MRSTLPGTWLALLFWTAGITLASDTACVNYLTARRGVISSPNFPGAFDVPLSCRWIINASDYPWINGSIIIYLTQLYVYKGFKITEYAYYESETTNYGANVIKEITEGNIFDFKSFRSSQPYLVLYFDLDRLEGNHVRVLDNLLDVFGFNVTYEITEADGNSRSCSVRECSFAGNCFLSADYQSFYCDCFEGFSGGQCGEGPLCLNDLQDSVCKNGGTCRHVGAKAVRCLCPDAFTGDTCEIPLLNTRENDCEGEDCILQCPFLGENEPVCRCKDGTRIYNSRSRYECKIKLSNVTALYSTMGSVETLLNRQLTEYLRNSNISSMDDLTILNVTSSSEVTFHFFGNTNDGDKIREALNRLVQRRRLNKIALEPTHFTFQQKPALRLQSLTVNHVNEREVRLGDQFVLTCVAQGSYGINFTWYKDNMLANVSKSTREIWYRNLPNDASDMHTSQLTIDKATLLDAGQYTCQIVDWGVQQCKSIYIDVKDEPNVKITPMSATIERGSDIQLICTTPNMQSTGIGFGWTKNKALLKLDPGNEVWEDLYPAGSILKITNAQKSAIYTCNVAHKSMSIRVEVVNRSLIPICLEEELWGLKWPDTAPGSEALLNCPRHFVGRQVSRLCSMKDATTPEWQTPDFSTCLYEPLVQPYNDFRSLTLGYQKATIPRTIRDIWEVLRARNSPLYPGEGDRLLSILTEIQHYEHNVADVDILRNSIEELVQVINEILNNVNAIFNRQKLLSLNQIFRQSLIYWSFPENVTDKHLVYSSVLVDVKQMRFDNNDAMQSLQIPVEHGENMYPDWHNERVTFRVDRKKFKKSSISGIVIVYKDINVFLSQGYVKVLNKDADVEHRINSRVINVAVSPLALKEESVWVDLHFQHLANLSLPLNASCGFLNNAGVWKLDVCIATVVNTSATHCLCPRTGTFAAFLTLRNTKVILVEQELMTFVGIVGCGLGFLQCLLTLAVTAFLWFKNRIWLNFLKIQCCGAIAAAMAIFTYAMYNYLSINSFSTVAVCLEAFLFIGMSAPISQALIIYAEFSNIRPSQHFQPTVIALITGVPILALLATELTHKSTNLRHESWWLIFGSGVYNIFVICTTVMLLIFVLLYIGVLHKSCTLVEENIIKKEMIETRVRMLHRAAVIICGIIAMEASSIFYVNSSSIVYRYVFSTFAGLLGFIIMVMYVLASEHKIMAPILNKFKCKSEDGDEHTSEPIKVCSKASGEVENEAAPVPLPPLMGESCLETRGVACGSLNMRDYISESVAVSYTKTSVPKRYLPEIRVDHSDDINLENYSTSPRKYQESTLDTTFSKRSPTFAPESSSFRDYAGASHFCGLPSVSLECSAEVLCNADVEARFAFSAMPDVTLAVKAKESELAPNPLELKNREHANAIPDIANTAKRKQPEGQEKIDEKPVAADCESTTTGMLDRISHDLDYLLNRTHANEGA